MIALIAVIGVTACDDDVRPVDTLSPLTTTGEALFDFEWCEATKQMYGDIDGLIAYMNEGNPTGVPPEVEAQARAAYEDCY